MKTRYIAIPIVILAVFALAAFSTPAMAVCVCDVETTTNACNNGTNGTIDGTVYVDGDGESELGTKTVKVNFEDIPDGVTIKWARVYWHIWGGTLSNTGWSNATFCNETQCWNNNRSITSTCEQNDTMGWYKGGSGTHWVYWNVTNNVSTGSNNITIDSSKAISGGWDGRTMWVYMVAVLEDNTKYSKINYTINQGYEDLAKSAESKTFFYGPANDSRNGTLWHLGLASHGDFDILFSNHLEHHYPAIGGFMDLEKLKINSNNISANDNNMTWDNDDFDDFHPVMAIFMDTVEQDLTVTDIDVGTPRPNNDSTVNVTVKNWGDASTGHFNVSLYIDDVLNGTVNVTDGLSAGASTTVSFTKVNESKDCYEFKVIVDVDGVITESNENNNATTVSGQVGYVIDVEDYHDFDDLVTESTNNLLGAGSVTHSGDTYYIKNFTGTSAIVNWAGDGISIQNLNTTTKFEINNCTIENCTGSGVFFNNLTNGTIKNSTVQNNTDYGIEVGLVSLNSDDPDNVSITNNTIDDNNYGIELIGFNCTVSNNTITNSTMFGIYLFANDTNITYNNITNNTDYGVKLYNCSDNYVYENNFTDNNDDSSGHQAWDNRTTNHWNTSAKGNWWSDFKDNSGYPCNYSIDGGTNKDYKPEGPEHVYNFSCGASEDKWAFRYQVDTIPPNTCDVPNTEFSNPTDYNKIKTDDTNYREDTAMEDNLAAHRFNFSISEDTNDIDKINVTWIGKGLNDGMGQGVSLYIWNFTSGNYGSALASNSNQNKVTLTGEKMNADDYIDSSGNVTVLAVQNDIGGDWGSIIHTYYVEVVIYT